MPEGRAANQPWAVVTLSPPIGASFPGARVSFAQGNYPNEQGELVNLSPRPALCFNPILGAVTEAPAAARLHLGAANATGLEWGARPAFLARQVSAQCRGGVLYVSRPQSSALRRSGSWADRRKVEGFNLFYADIEADARQRLASYLAQ